MREREPSTRQSLLSYMLPFAVDREEYGLTEYAERVGGDRRVVADDLETLQREDYLRSDSHPSVWSFGSDRMAELNRQGFDTDHATFDNESRVRLGANGREYMDERELERLDESIDYVYDQL